MFRRIAVGGAAAALLGFGALVGPGYVSPSVAHAVTCAPGTHKDQSGKCIKDEKKPEPKTPEKKTPEKKTPEKKTPEKKTPEKKTPENKAAPTTKPVPSTPKVAPKTTTPKTPAPKTPAPSGNGAPTAKCKDGTSSYAKHHEGACSNHGGVATWLG